MARGEAGQGSIFGVECGHNELSRDLADLPEQPGEVTLVEFRGRVIHK